MTQCVSLVMLVVLSSPALAQYKAAQVDIDKLPTEHAYQRALRDYLGALTEAELTIDLKKPFTVAAGAGEPEDQYRMWLLTLHLPAVEAATLPPSAFTLKAIESGKGISMPAGPHTAQMLAWLAKWDYPGNPHFNSAPLKRRAFVLAALDTILLDYLYDHKPLGSDRSDFLGGNLIWLGYTYKHVQDAIPAEARQALAAGLKRHVGRLEKWGPRGAMTDMDLFAAVGLRYVADGLKDPDVTRSAETYVKRLFTDPRFFHPAGYFVDVGCFDTSYNGISLYFATWSALASDWKFARDAVDQGYRLRGLLSLPEPTGGAIGPSHMSSRTSADPPHDQWNFAHRPYAAAMATDHALHLAPLPAPDVMKTAAARVVGHLNNTFAKSQPAAPSAWRETHWSGMINFAHEHYKPGYYPRRLALEKEKSELLKPPYARAGTFDLDLANTFLIARKDGFAAVVHTGPIRGWPHGMGGGMLSAFWTPASGPVLLGRRRAMQGPNPDKLEDWRNWAVHAVSGATSAGDFFSSAMLTQPKADYKPEADATTVRVEGPLAAGKNASALSYERRFAVKRDGVSIRTTLTAKPETSFKEIFETLPVFLHDPHHTLQAKDAKTTIRFQVGDQWLDATTSPTSNVAAIRVDRFKGGILVQLDRPRIVQLAPSQWTDDFQTRAACQTVLVDLLPTKDNVAAIEYTITPAAR